MKKTGREGKNLELCVVYLRMLNLLFPPFEWKIIIKEFLFPHIMTLESHRSFMNIS